MVPIFFTEINVNDFVSDMIWSKYVVIVFHYHPACLYEVLLFHIEFVKLTHVLCN